MSRERAISHAERYFDEGGFFAELARRVAIPTESQNPDRAPDLARYLSGEMQPSLEKLGFRCRTFTHAKAKGPFLLAERVEDPALLTVFTYGHGDVIRGQEKSWRAGLDPWTLKREGDRLYGRGTADNKGQHTINLAALTAALETRGKLGFNVKMLIETGEEVGSPGLREVCAEHKKLFEADVLIASDGPRLSPGQPTIFLGTRGAFNMDLTVDLRAGGHHSGNWGGLLANPGIILAQALATITGPRGEIRVPEWRPTTLTGAVRETLSGLEVDGGEDAPEIDRDWGEPGLTPIERMVGWSSFEVLAYVCGDPAKPVNAIPPRASCHCQLRYVVGIDPEDIAPALERHLAKAGFPMVKVSPSRDGFFKATRLDVDHPWVKWTARSMSTTSGKQTVVLPNLGGSLPNDIFSDLLGLPTVWIPHSYASCSQHAPNEHMLAPVARDALRLMAGVMWDLGELKSAPG
jgi:acetylornithine deacetylase/succinyl-diaminopimelate desuccinylase-like protein